MPRSDGAEVAEAALPPDAAPPLDEAPLIFGPRYLRYLAVGLLLLGLFERSDLLSLNGLLVLVAALALLAVVGLGLGLSMASRGDDVVLTPLHYTIPLMAVLVAAAISSIRCDSCILLDWRAHLASQTLMGVAFFASGYVTMERFLGRERPGHLFLRDASVILVLLGAYLAVLIGVTNLGLRLVLLFVATLGAAYEGLARVTLEPARAVVGALIVAQVVTAIAFGLIAYQFLDVGRLATILLVAWYANRGFGIHLLEGTLSRRIFGEYALLAVLAVILVATALLNR